MADEYRGFRYKIVRAEKLMATIWAPRVLQCLSIKPTATLKEGNGVLLGRISQVIDKEIARSEEERRGSKPADRR